MTAGAVARVLVVRRRALGDLVLSLPALAELRRRLPGARLDLLVDRPLTAAARAWSVADRVLEFPDRSTSSGLGRTGALAALARRLAAERYDLVIDLHSTPQTALLTRLTGAPRRAGLDLRGRAWAYTVRVPRPGSEPGPDGRPRYIAAALLDLVARALGEPAQADADVEPHLANAPGRGARPRGERRAVALAPGATWTAKAWPAPAYRELAQRAAAEWGARVMVFWGPGEEALAHAVADGLPGVEVAPAGDVLALGEQLREFDLMISGDSGARHIAVAAGLPTLALFGPTDPWTATPPGGRHRWLRYPIACSPCQRTVCPLAENHCFTRVRPDEVLAAAREMPA
jgi:ADP-heptose:LPS heptosyltransferase